METPHNHIPAASRSDSSDAHSSQRHSEEANKRNGSVLRVLALDSSPQTTALLVMAAEGVIGRFDLAIYADCVTDRPQIFARSARAQQIAHRACLPILRITSDGPPADAIQTKILQILGHQQPPSTPPHLLAELAIGVSPDDIHLATDSDLPSIKHVFPLLELGWSRRDCDGYLRSLHQTRTPKQWRRGWGL